MNYKNHEFNWIEEYLNGRAEFEAMTWAATEQKRRNNTPTPTTPEVFVESVPRTLLEEYLNSISPTTKKEA